MCQNTLAAGLHVIVHRTRPVLLLYCSWQWVSFIIIGPYKSNSRSSFDTDGHISRKPWLARLYYLNSMKSGLTHPLLWRTMRARSALRTLVAQGTCKLLALALLQQDADTPRYVDAAVTSGSSVLGDHIGKHRVVFFAVGLTGRLQQRLIGHTIAVTFRKKWVQLESERKIDLMAVMNDNNDKHSFYFVFP